MDIDELQTVQSRERQTDSLQQLRDSFYSEASEFIQQLREARDDAAQRADDPWDNPEVNRLSDEIKTAEQTAEAIYDRRVGKIVKKASLAAAEMPTDEDGLTSEEQALFERLVENIQDNRGHVLDMIAGDVEPGTSPVSTDSNPADSEPNPPPAQSNRQPPAVESDSEPQTAKPTDDESVSAADVMNTDGGTKTVESEPTQAKPPETTPEEQASPSAETESSPDESADVSRRTVRITKDVGEIFGVDQREYDLSTDDVVTLPADNAEPLLQRDAAQPLD